jgi:hypothetical protein
MNDNLPNVHSPFATDAAAEPACACPRPTIVLTERPIRTTDIDIQPLRLAVPVAGYAALDLELQILEGSDVEIRVLTSMQNDSEDGWVEVDRFVPTSAGRAVRKPFFPLLKYVRWEVLSVTDATFVIQGVGRRSLGFVPPEIAGCILWLRSDLAVTVVSGNVSAWGDRSGNGNNATQLTVADQPGYLESGWSNGLPTLEFDRANTEFMSLGSMSNSSGSYTIFAALDQRNQTSHPQDLIGTRSPTRVVALVTNLSAGVGIFDGSWKGAGAEQNGQQLLTWVLDGAAGGFECFRNGASIGTGSYVGSWGWGRPELGRLESTGQLIDAELAEVILYNRVLSSPERARTHAYLAARYGL